MNTQKPLFKHVLFIIIFSSILITACQKEDTGYIINDQGYFEMPGANIIVFDDYYPMGHQSGLTIIQNEVRVAANGNLRLQGRPEVGKKEVDTLANIITCPLTYPDIPLNYNVKVRTEGKKAFVSLNLDNPLPKDWENRAWFYIELFPAPLIGKSWNMDNQTGIFPTDSYGPMENDELVPYAEGKVFTAAPETEDQRLSIRAINGNLQFVDGRTHSKGGWFVLRTAVPADATEKAVEWEIDIFPEENYVYKPVIHISQVGYLPDEPKRAVVEIDKRTNTTETLKISRINPDGTRSNVFSKKAELWGKFLRYNYAVCDFTSLTEPGIYQIEYGDSRLNIFKVGPDIYKRYVWQPTLEYFLPIQMCHMRIEKGSRVWHDWCHLDDALMAPLNHEHFDGYSQGPESFVDFVHPEHVPELDRGGWHDAGDYDLRIESQATTTWRLALMHELFGIDLDVTRVDQENKLAQIHEPDGISDALQQVEHGVLTVLGGYRGLGRLYDGIISSTGKQYGLKGDGSAMTDNLDYNPRLDTGRVTATQSGIKDDRWVFTEDHPGHEMIGIAGLASASRVLKDYRPALSQECIEAAIDLYAISSNKEMVDQRIAAAAELFYATEDEAYIEDIIEQKEYILENMDGTAWAVGRIYSFIEDGSFREDMDKAVKEYAEELAGRMNSTPFGVPYEPNVWGDGWSIQSLGVKHYFLVTGFPDVFDPSLIYNAMQFMLGCHPGSNTESFASGVGANSLLAAYGVNRADFSYYPGGVASGTAIIRPDFPELKDDWSFIWQQSEYVLGGGATNFMFLVLATDQLLGD